MKSLDRESYEEQLRLVPRYVAGDLSRSERAEFESWLVASPDLAAEVEMERRLRRGIASANRRGWIHRKQPAASGLNRRTRVALAASVVLALVAVGLKVFWPGSGPDAQVTATHTTTPEPAHQRIAAMPRSVHLSGLRGVSDVPDVSYSLADAPSELDIEPDVVILTCENGVVDTECAGGTAPQTPQYPEYELDVVEHRGSALAWRSARQSPLANSPLSFTLRNPGELAAGDYDIVVRGHAPDHEEVVARFWLRVTD